LAKFKLSNESNYNLAGLFAEGLNWNVAVWELKYICDSIVKMLDLGCASLYICVPNSIKPRISKY
jgi:hypothetical protein